MKKENLKKKTPKNLKRKFDMSKSTRMWILGNCVPATGGSPKELANNHTLFTLF